MSLLLASLCTFTACHDEEEPPASTGEFNDELDMSTIEGDMLSAADLAEGDDASQGDDGHEGGEDLATDTEECEAIARCVMTCDQGDPITCSATCSEDRSSMARASAANLAFCLDESACVDIACAERECDAELAICRGDDQEGDGEDMAQDMEDMAAQEDMSDAEDMGGGRVLPEAGYAACEALRPMADCTWTSPRGELEGTCRRLPQTGDMRLFCLPNDFQGGGMGDMGRRRDMGSEEDMGR